MEEIEWIIVSGLDSNSIEDIFESFLFSESRILGTINAERLTESFHREYIVKLFWRLIVVPLNHVYV